MPHAITTVRHVLAAAALAAPPHQKRRQNRTRQVAYAERAGVAAERRYLARCERPLTADEEADAQATFVTGVLDALRTVDLSWFRAPRVSIPLCRTRARVRRPRSRSRRTRTIAKAGAPPGDSDPEPDSGKFGTANRSRDLVTAPNHAELRHVGGVA